ncbi:kelch repeat-containing protein [Chondromyces crocatus]|uniref:kelch repeat-containing protein n=1 Tax=Chondromyces crocatus TaxID=52 RepID=UPI0012E192D5|nr:kelch repeat-containing protein [Chondromyces crocatus]
MSRLHALRAAFSSALDDIPGGHLSRTSAGTYVAGGRDRASAIVELPAVAAGEAVLTDVDSGVAIRFSLQGALSTPISVAEGGFALYQAALPVDSGVALDVVHRVHAGGTEDFVVLERALPQREIRYRVDVARVGGLRLVERTLEFLDDLGTPRLRVAPPELVGRDGARHPAGLALEGCAADTDPRAPWGRPVTPPGGAFCTVVVTWDDARVAYPALLDPSWVSTKNNMVVGRTRHAIAELEPGAAASRVLLTGGFNASGNAVSSAEIYEPLSRTFAATGPMATARGAHTATSLVTLPVSLPAEARPVLVAGGGSSSNLGSATPLASLEVYSPASGTFITDDDVMALPRFNHTATLLDGARVLLAGGISSPLNQPTNSAYVYQFTSLNGVNLISTLTATGNTLGSSRHAHAAVRLLTGNVLITGGFVLSGTALPAAEIYQALPPPGSFTPVTSIAPSTNQMTSLRGHHTATLLATGEVLIAGGTTQVSGGLYTNTIDIYNDGVQNPTRRGFEFQPTPIAMGAARANHTATLLPTGQVVIAGGFNGTANITSQSATEIFSPTARAFSPLGGAASFGPRRDHAAILVNAGDKLTAGRSVLISGGSGPGVPGGPLSSAQLLIKALGETCDIGQECASGHCTDGVCCDEACNQQCYSCAATLKQDSAAANNGVCGPTRADTPLPIQCLNEIEVHNECDGNGNSRQDGATRDCKPGTCGPSGVCILGCNSDADCSLTGWCDLSTPPEPGGTGGMGGHGGGAPGVGGTGGTGGTGGGGGAGGMGGSAGAGGAGGEAGAGGAAGAGGSGATGGGGAGAAGGSGGGGGALPEYIGSCKPRFPDSTVCERGRQCVSGNCVDGYCCNIPCEGQCQACDVINNIGVCTAVGSPQQPEAPHPNLQMGAAQREPCPGLGDCAGRCIGNADALCVFPDANQIYKAPECGCTDDECSTPAILSRFYCDGDGSFVTQTERCGGDDLGFRCADASACKASCTTDADCVVDFICADGGRCIDLRTNGPSCDGEFTLRIAEAPDQDCSPYRCPAGGNACPASCQSIADCVGGKACNAAGECVDAPEAPELLSCSCRAAGATSTREPWSVAFAGLAFAVTMMRRRRRG